MQRWKDIRINETLKRLKVIKSLVTMNSLNTVVGELR